MPFINSVAGTRTPLSNKQVDFGQSGLTIATAFTTAAAFRANSTTSGNYYFKLPGMVSTRQLYVDVDNTGGPADTKWIRIFMPSGFNYAYQISGEDVDSWPNSDIPALIDSFPYFMYTFVNMNTNARFQSWYFAKPSSNATAFRNTPPTVHGGEGAPLITQITAVRMSTGENYTSYLRSGVSSFGAQCDDSRSSFWGYTCLKAGNTPNTGSGGYSDFPSYATYSVNSTGGTTYPTDCADSSQTYSTTKCSATKQFAIYLG